MAEICFSFRREYKWKLSFISHTNLSFFHLSCLKKVVQMIFDSYRTLRKYLLRIEVQNNRLTWIQKDVLNISVFTRVKWKLRREMCSQKMLEWINLLSKTCKVNKNVCCFKVECFTHLKCLSFTFIISSCVWKYFVNIYTY